MAPTRPQVEDLNRYIFYLTQDWNGLGGAIIQVGFERMSGGQNVGTIRVTPLGHYLCQAWGTSPDIAPV